VYLTWHSYVQTSTKNKQKMKNLIVLFLLAFGLTSNSQTNVNIASSVERHAIVVPSDPQKFQTFAKENNYRISQNWEQLGWYLIDLPEGVSYQEAANKMKGVVKNVYPDTEQIYNRDYVPNDPLFPYAWYLKQSNEIFGLDRRALAGEPGVYTHNSVRRDKVDIYPHPKMIQMLKSL
jgi:hypothetical protein